MSLYIKFLMTINYRIRNVNKLYIIFLLTIIIVINAQDNETEVFEHDDVGFKIGFGLMDGNDYSDDLKSAIDNISGYLGWINLEAAIEFRVYKNLYFQPGISVKASRISYQYEDLDGYSSTHFNSIFLLNGGFTYYFLKRFYTNFSIGSGSTNSSINALDFQSDGLAKSITIGCEFHLMKRTLNVEIGYSSIPIKSSYNSYTNNTDTRNYGGLFFNLAAVLPLGNYNTADE